MEQHAAEVRQILADPPDTSVQRALYWLRWAYNARTVPEAFLFAWMAVERLAGEKEMVAKCSKCQGQYAAKNTVSIATPRCRATQLKRFSNDMGSRA